MLHFINGLFATYSPVFRTHVVFVAAAFFIFSGLSPLQVSATQTDIAGPVGSGQFGATVTALPNGNFVVADTLYDEGGANDIGAVYLYDGTTLAIISTLKGSTLNDNVGSGGITVLTNGNFVVRSQNWDNGLAADAGAVTWCSATTGCNGVVSSANSLVGGTASDQVGSGGVRALTNGNYVVSTFNWDNPTGPIADVGAATWCSGTAGGLGLVTSANSLTGGAAGNQVGSGGSTALINGNYVVRSPGWDNPTGPVADVGAATWGNGATGTVSVVSSANSLIGGAASDQVSNGGVAALTNGNYVVRSSVWDNPTGPASDAGAATWGNGATGTTGTVSSANSLVGGSANDGVGNNGLTVLTNGNYVVNSSFWNDPTGPISNVGAVTWGNGAGGTVGLVSSANSLIGGRSLDRIGINGVIALTNGNYVAISPGWDNPTGPISNVGAATWGNGVGGTVGLVTTSNSLVGNTANDNVGNNATALRNGHYVVSTGNWDNPTGPVANVGAATWCNGTTGSVGLVTTANSLTGSKSGDLVGAGGMTALTNGNYVVKSSGWANPSLIVVGAATWGNGASGTTGVVSSANSLVGNTASDNITSHGVTALTNGNYVVSSGGWTNPSGPIAGAGAVTWGNGAGGTVGLVSSANSLIGGTAGDNVGSISGATPLSNGNYVLNSQFWDNPGGPFANAGAVSLGDGTSGGTVGLVSSTNSVLGTVATGGGATLVFSFNETRNALIVGRPASNLVSLLFYGTTTATGNGNFNSPGTWGGSLPGGLDTAVIPPGVIIFVPTSGGSSFAGLINVNGTLSGTGTLNGNLVVNSGGTLAPGTSPGRLTVNGNVTLNSGSTFAVEIGGTAGAGVNPNGHDQLAITGAATLGGVLNVTLTNGFTPAAGNSFVVLDATTLSGTFTNIVLPGISPLAWQISLNAATGDVTLVVVTPTAAPATISGTVTTSDGTPLAGVTMNLNGATSVGAITDSNGNYRFDNVDTDRFYTVTPSLANFHFNPVNRSFSLVGNKTDALFTATADAVVSANAIDTTEFFVRQQYLDFLNREPDPQGWLFWTEQISRCGADENCIRQKRLDVSAAFFASEEFQQSGNYIYRLYRAGLSRQLTYAEFSEDRRQVVGGADLESSRAAFADAFVERAEFVQKYANATSAEAFVVSLLEAMRQDTGVDLFAQHDALLEKYNAGGSLNQSRSAVLQALTDNSAYQSAVYNPSFVLMEYFGYLRRDADQNGFDFWLNVLSNGARGNYRGLVCSFITSAEYQRRFSPIVTHTNAECSK